MIERIPQCDESVKILYKKDPAQFLTNLTQGYVDKPIFDVYSHKKNNIQN